jgi:hypothetical protein
LISWFSSFLVDTYREMQLEPGSQLGGDDPPIRSVRAMRGKRLRAEPVALRYEQGRVHHVGRFPEMEEQMTEWLPESGESPDRLDALVHGLTRLRRTEQTTATASSPVNPNPQTPAEATAPPSSPVVKSPGIGGRNAGNNRIRR